jgi:hypothetical protein
MRYVSLSSSSLPIGSGVTESAAKTVVGRRAKTSGQRWSEPGLRGVLTLRGLQQSDRLLRFWKASVTPLRCCRGRCCLSRHPYVVHTVLNDVARTAAAASIELARWQASQVGSRQ